MSRIFYATDSPLISGGHYVIRDHVIGLRSLGFEAYILASKEVIVEAYAHFMPADWVVVADKGLSVTPDDFVVIPEPWKDILNRLQRVNVRKILHVQNPFYVFHGFSSVTALNEYGLSAILSCSLFTTNYLHAIGISAPIFTIRPKVDSVFFNVIEKARRICYMPRKRRIESNFIKGLFFSIYPKFSSVEWISIDGISRENAAKIMGSSRVFLSLSWLEGLGLPPIEAMAAGCIPIGFKGGGGGEYANAANGFWHSEDDYMGIARSMAQALELDEGSDTLSLIRENGRKTVDEFSDEKFLSGLLKTWQALVSKVSRDL